jgi:hypothetical protein
LFRVQILGLEDKRLRISDFGLREGSREYQSSIETREFAANLPPKQHPL